MLTYPAGATGGSRPLAVLAHQYPATRDSCATPAFDERGLGDPLVSPLGPAVVNTAGARLTPLGASVGGSGVPLAMAVCFAVPEKLARSLGDAPRI